MSGLILAGCLVLLLVYGYWIMTKLSDYLNSGKICRESDDSEEKPDVICPSCGYRFPDSARKKAPKAVFLQWIESALPTGRDMRGRGSSAWGTPTTP